MSTTESIHIIPSDAGSVTVDVTLSSDYHHRTYHCRVTASGDAYAYSVRCRIFPDHQASGASPTLPSALEAAMAAARSLFREAA